jgi:hypothetical protein
MKAISFVLVLLAAIAAFVFVVFTPPYGMLQNNTQMQPKSANPSQASSNNLDAVMPDGATLTFSEFEAQAGPQLAALLAPLSVKTITRHGDQFILECTPGTLTTSAVSATIASTVKARVQVNGPTMSMSDIDGVTVDLGILGSGHALREVTITPIDSTTAKVDGKLEIASWLPLFPFTAEIDMNQVH